jgi:SAM-dependent methyltransferase
MTSPAHDAVTTDAATAEEDGVVDSLRLQAEEHPLIEEDAPQSPAEKTLHLIHLKAYEEARRLTADRDVLDVGCNTGYGTVRLCGDARSVTGVDVSPAAIDRARTREGAEQVEFRVIDGITLPFADGSFDLVTSFQVIEHVTDTASYLREIRRVLRPGGQALFTTPNAAIRLDPGMTPWNKFHVREYLADELQAELEAVFPVADVRGLFAVPTLQEIETARVDEARRYLRRQLLAAASRAAAEERRLAEEANPTPAPPPAPRPSALKRLRRSLGRSRVGVATKVLLGRAPTTRTVVTVVAPPAPEPEPALVVDVDQFGLEDLFFARHDLDRSLDLAAACSVDPGPGAG